MDAKHKLAQVAEKLKISAESKKQPDDYNPSKHDYRKAQTLDGGTVFGMRLFNLRICRTCKRVEVIDGTYERDKSLPLVKGLSFKPSKDEGCTND